MRRQRHQVGFTLLELLIAVAVLAIVMAIIYETYWVCTKNVAAAQERSDLYQSARLALRRLSDDLMGAYVPLKASAETEEEEEPSEGEAPAAEEEGEEEASEEGVFRSLDIGSGPASQDTLEFVSTANLGRGAAAYVDFCELRYGVNGGVLTRTSTTVGMGGDAESFELASNVKGLDFKFFGADGEEQAEWDSSQSGQLPSTVQITLYMGAGEDEAAAVPFTTAVNIPLAWEREALGQNVAALAAEEEGKEKGEEAAQGAADEEMGEDEEDEGAPGQPADEDEDDDDW